MARHVSNNGKIARFDEGMEVLVKANTQVPNRDTSPKDMVLDGYRAIIHRYDNTIGNGDPVVWVYYPGSRYHSTAGESYAMYEQYIDRAVYTPTTPLEIEITDYCNRELGRV